MWTCAHGKEQLDKEDNDFMTSNVHKGNWAAHFRKIIQDNHNYFFFFFVMIIYWL